MFCFPSVTFDFYDVSFSFLCGACEGWSLGFLQNFFWWDFYSWGSFWFFPHHCFVQPALLDVGFLLLMGKNSASILLPVWLCSQELHTGVLPLGHEPATWDSPDNHNTESWGGASSQQSQG